MSTSRSARGAPLGCECLSRDVTRASGWACLVLVGLAWPGLGHTTRGAALGRIRPGDGPLRRALISPTVRYLQHNPSHQQDPFPSPLLFVGSSKNFIYVRKSGSTRTPHRTSRQTAQHNTNRDSNCSV